MARFNQTNAEILASYFSGQAALDKARQAIDSYFNTDGFTGSCFEKLSDIDNPNEITARDIIAVSTLSVNIPANVCIWLLSDDGRSQIRELLSKVPVNLDLWDADEHLTSSQPLWKLWDLLNEGCWPVNRTNNGMGYTSISKIIAAKRPRLLPIQDSVIQSVFTEKTENFWTSIGDVLKDTDLRATIREATKGAPEYVSLLRRIDVVIWMLNRKKK